ncbi:MAG: glycosyltransferase family 4 protein [Steroidobacteraceae bacterium]|nr:glycosyltransferase family 4 protein [Deltaproteobacteria bacterium]
MLAPTPYFADRGCHVRIYEEARALTALGHEVCIVTYHLGRDMPGVRVVRIPIIPWYKKLDAGPSWHKPYLDMLLLLKAYNTARSFRPDVIHAHLHEGALIGYLLKRLLCLPLLFDYQGSLSGESINHGFLREKSLFHRLFVGIERGINHFADAIITSSGAGRRELISDYGIPSEKIHTLIDGVDAGIFRPCSRLQARRELGISEDAKVVVYLGLFNQYQGLDLLLDAITSVRDKVPGVHFLLMGFPDEEYRRKAARMGIADVITFTGRVPYQSAPLFLSAGDLAVSPKLARTEANGKLFNYMACGLPTVAFENDINREILGECGIYAEYGSMDSLADQIVTVLNDCEMMAKLGRQSRERAVKVHSWEVRAAQLTEVYRDLLESKAKNVVSS